MVRPPGQNSSIRSVAEVLTSSIRAIAARRLLRPGGLVAVEHGAPQGPAVYWTFAEEHGWADTRNHKDLARRDRFVTARWPGR